MTDSPAFNLRLADAAAQEAFGARLAEACCGPLRIYLEGELGAGKTTLVRGFLRHLGYLGAVKSPTYTLIEPYELEGRCVYHLDLYRVCDPVELEYLGLRELLAEDALVLIEWPERAASWLPPPDIRLSLQVVGNARQVALQALSTRAVMPRNLLEPF